MKPSDVVHLDAIEVVVHDAVDGVDGEDDVSVSLDENEDGDVDGALGHDEDAILQ